MSDVMCDVRIEMCSGCYGEGRIYHGEHDDEWSEECVWCDGTGGELVPCLPIELADLDEISGGFSYGRYGF